jgi:hypothetical protein
MATGGDLIEATYNHPTIGTGTLFFKANEDSTFDLGGYRSNDDANMLDGSGAMIDQINQVRWRLEGTISWDMNERAELTSLTDLSASPELSDWTFSHVNGTIWAGKGKPVGDIQGAGMGATSAIIIAGGGKLNKLS